MAGIFEVDEVRQRDLSFRAFMLESEDCPLMQMLRDGKKPESNSLTEWTAKALPLVNPTGILEGAPVTTFKGTKRIPLGTYVQQFQQPWSVSKRANLIQSAGKESATEAGEQATDAMVLLRRQNEQQILSISDTFVQIGAQPYTMRGIGAWLSAVAQAQQPVPAVLLNSPQAIYTDTMANLTQDAFEAAIIAATKERKAKVTLELILGSLLQAKINSFVEINPVTATSSAVVRYEKGNGRTFERMTDVLNFNGSIVRTHLSFFIGYDVSKPQDAVPTDYTDRSGYAINLKQWDLGWMQPPMPFTLPIDGSGPRGYVEDFLALRCYDPRGQVKFWISQ